MKGEDMMMSGHYGREGDIKKATSPRVGCPNNYFNYAAARRQPPTFAVTLEFRVFGRHRELFVKPFVFYCPL